MSVSHGGNSAKTSIETPVQGISFQFRWGPPPRAAVPEMQQRLRALCKDKDDITDVRALPSTRMACALLDLPDVADGLTDEELGKAAVLTGAFNQDLRLSALKCLFERDPRDRRFLVELDQSDPRQPGRRAPPPSVEVLARGSRRGGCVCDAESRRPIRGPTSAGGTPQ